MNRRGFFKALAAVPVAVLVARPVRPRKVIPRRKVGIGETVRVRLPYRPIFQPYIDPDYLRESAEYFNPAAIMARTRHG